MQRSLCTTHKDEREWDNLVWVNVINFALSAVSFLLIIKYFVDTSNLYRRMRDIYQSYEVKSKKLKKQEKVEKLQQLKKINTNFLSQLAFMNATAG